MNILFTELTPTPQLHPAEFLSRSYHLLAEANHFLYLIEKQIHNHSEKQFLANNQLYAPIPFNIFIYFQLSTCFEHVVFIIRRDQIVSTQFLVIVTPC
jgi:hypothetical protein